MLARTQPGRLVVKAARAARRVLPAAVCDPILRIKLQSRRRLADVYRTEVFEIERLLAWDLRSWLKD